MGVIYFLEHYFDDLPIEECVEGLDRFQKLLEKEEYKNMAKNLIGTLDTDELIQALEICLERGLLSEKARSYILKEIYVRTIPNLKIVKPNRTEKTGTLDLQGKAYVKKRGKRK